MTKREKILVALLFVLILCTLDLASTLPLVNGMATAEGLPDGRVYEMVTPAENYDADTYVPLSLPADSVESEGEFETSLPFRVAENGESVAFAAAPTVDGAGDGGLGGGNEYLARRSVGGGWGTPIQLAPTGENGAVVNSAYYQAFSPQLTLGILESGNYREPEGPVLSPVAPAEGYAVLYSHQLDGSQYQPFFVTKPANRDASEFRTAEVETPFSPSSEPLEYAGASQDYSRLLFEANGVFEGTGASLGGSSENNLYESIDGQLTLINVLPDGHTEPNATFGAEPLVPEYGTPSDFSDVISENGSRVFWTDRNAGKRALYLTENAGSTDERTVQVDASQVPGGVGGGARFWTASKDGSEVFFTDSDAARLTADTQPGSGENLYMYEVPTGRLVDLTPDVSAGVVGVVAETGDEQSDSTIYFVATGVLTGNYNSNHAKAEAGVDNLYVIHNGSPIAFVAPLTLEDGERAIKPLFKKIGENGDWTPTQGQRTAETSPSGASLAFMSNDQNIGGHNEAVNGVPLEEVYVYDDETGVLSCASCGRLHGIAPVETPEANRGLGAFLPISRAPTFQPTLISDDGSQVFFDSAEPLVPGDTNGEVDVYEWERDGAGGCRLGVGCVYLLSGGAGTTSSWLVGADATGDNVFFVTRAQLSPQDGNENYDLYDARVDGVQPVLPPACSGTGCQGVPGQAPTFATPSSVTFEGVGNFAPPAETATPAKPKAKSKSKAKVKRCKRGFVKKSGKCVKRARAKKSSLGGR
jgi:hypothetical protein